MFCSCLYNGSSISKCVTIHGTEFYWKTGLLLIYSYYFWSGSSCLGSSAPHSKRISSGPYSGAGWQWDIKIMLNYFINHNEHQRSKITITISTNVLNTLLPSVPANSWLLLHSTLSTMCLPLLLTYQTSDTTNNCRFSVSAFRAWPQNCLSSLTLLKTVCQ